MNLNPLSWIGNLVDTAASKVGDYFIRDKEMEAAEKAGKIRIKEAQVNAEIAKIEAETARQMMLSKAEIDWDTEAQRQMQNSWKDEFLLLAVWMPIILTMVGGFVDAFTVGAPIVTSIELGWKALSMVPDWYKLSAVGILIATYGLRWMADKILPALGVGRNRK